ncbi:MAG: hypothetical protein HOE90_12980 [Bacteriovoracaceae bacterium]|jgi:hypothetical protein|nr:hypothetical protein [Bacteriovoracaceae bacterium]
MIPKPYFNIVRNINDGTKKANRFLQQSDEARLQKRALNVLIDDLNELFLFIEPSSSNVNIFSHRCYDIHLRACVQVESALRLIFNKNGVIPQVDSIIGYSDLEGVMKLSEYDLRYMTLPLHNFKPFESFANPTRNDRSPKWYKEHNKVKHNRTRYFHLATLENAIHSVGALYAIIDAQYAIGYLHSDGNERSLAPRRDGIYLLEAIPTWLAAEKYYNFDWDALVVSGDPFASASIPVIP